MPFKISTVAKRSPAARAGLKAGDTVTAPFGASETPERAVVLRVDIASEQTPPLPVKRMKRVISVVARA